MIRSKFTVQVIEQHITGQKIQLSPVQSGSEENKAFSQYTPSGGVQLFIDKNAPAFDKFELGAQYYVDFTKVE